VALLFLAVFFAAANGMDGKGGEEKQQEHDGQGVLIQLQH
jgi:hypothetical protein